MLARFAVRHPVTVCMLFAAGALLGGLALGELPVDLLPELDAPRVAVQLRAGDRPPEELEERFARNLEMALSTLPGVRRVRTVSATGRVLATVEYDWDTDMDFALLDVQKQVQPLLANRDVESLVVRRHDPSEEPILVLGLSPPEPAGGGEPLDLDALRRTAEDRLARTLERIPGVASVEVGGGRRREVRVSVEHHRLEALGLSFDRIAQVLAQANADASAGQVEDAGRVYVIKGLGRFTGIEDIRTLPLPGTQAVAEEGGQDEASGPGRPLRLHEVASVEWADAPVRGMVLVDGREGVSLSVFKEAGKNTVAVADRVHEALAPLAAEVSPTTLVVVSDQSGFIRRAMRDVAWSALLGSVLAVFVLLLFLRRLGAVLLISLAIPISVVVTFAAMAAAGLSLNLMTLGGLALGAGMLIDNAIVVLEAITRRREEGQDAITSAIDGTNEVAGALVASTLTTCVVFLPVVFLEGIAAELFTDLAFTVALSLAASLAVALLLIPTAAARVLRATTSRRTAAPPARRARRYGGALRLCLRAPIVVFILVVAVAAAALVALPRLDLELLPASDAGEVKARVLLPEGTRVTVTREAVAAIQQAVRRAVPEAIAASAAELGFAIRAEGALTDEIPAENQGLLRLRLTPADQRSVTTGQVERLLERAAGHVEGLSLRLEPTDAVLGSLLERGAPVRVELRGTDLGAIEDATSLVAEALSKRPELYDVHSSFEERRAEVRVVLDRLLAAGLGLSPEDVARQLSRRLGAEAATVFRQDGEDRDVVVTAARRDLRALSRLVLDAPSGEPIQLGQLARVEIVQSPSRIERSLGARLGSVGAHVSPGFGLAEASAAVEAELQALTLPAGTRASLGGAEVERRASYRELALALGLAVLLVYMVMAALFESVLAPAAILFTLPTAGAGVVLASWASQTPLSVPTLLGAVMLAGIAVNNGILLVDLGQRLVRSGADRMEAVVEAGRRRARPILMTSVTTVLAMLPLALGWGEGSDLRSPLAIAVIGGLVVSTLLTLFVVPTAHHVLLRARPARGAAASAAGRDAAEPA